MRQRPALMDRLKWSGESWPRARAGLPSASRVNLSEAGSRPRRSARTIREASAATRRCLRTSGVPRAARSRSSVPSHRRGRLLHPFRRLVETHLPDLEFRRSHAGKDPQHAQDLPSIGCRGSPMDDDPPHVPRPPHHRHPARLLPRGAYPLVEPEAAATRRAGVLAAFRAGGEPVVHLRHVWDAPDATFMRPGTEGVEIHPLVAPADGEPVIDKAAPNGFLDTRARARVALDGHRFAGGGGDDEQHVRRRDGAGGRGPGLRRDRRTRRVRRAGPRVRGQRYPRGLGARRFMAALGDGYATLVAGRDLPSA